MSNNKDKQLIKFCKEKTNLSNSYNIGQCTWKVKFRKLLKTLKTQNIFTIIKIRSIKKSRKRVNTIKNCALKQTNSLYRKLKREKLLKIKLPFDGKNTNIFVRRLRI